MIAPAPSSAVRRGLDVDGVSKTYGGVQALSNVRLAIAPGQVHALVGENGAGKSTLIKIIAGVVAPDAGVVRVDGRVVPAGRVLAARDAGLATIYQESTAFPDLNAVDNLFVGREQGMRSRMGLLDRHRMRAQTIEILAELGEHIDVDRPVAELSLASRQMIAIARALSQRSTILILDEPTASLSAPECDALFRAMATLRARGIGMLYVSHRLAEIFALSDQVTVLRDGHVVAHRPTREFTEASLIHSMVGREIVSFASPADSAVESAEDDAPATQTRASATSSPRRAVLTVTRLTREPAFRDVSFTVHAGEIVGLAGLVGAGRSDVARAVFGVDRLTHGEVTVDGRRLTPGAVTEAVAAGVALVPEDRQQLGLVLPVSVRENLLLSVLRRVTRYGIRARRVEQAMVHQLITSLDIRAESPDMPVDALSGGNQQKVVVGKWLATQPRVLMLDEPTRGVDVGAKAELYRLIRSLAHDGMATLLISSDLPEILALSDRILVMRQGIIAGELSRADATEERILALAMPDEQQDTMVRLGGVGAG